jgi:hypothetical protein
MDTHEKPSDNSENEKALETGNQPPSSDNSVLSNGQFASK